MATHRELVIALRDHPETSPALRAELEPFAHEAPSTVPAHDEPHAFASSAGTSACSVCQHEHDHELHAAVAAKA